MFAKDLFACFLRVLRILRIFTEWHLRRPDINKPIVFLKRLSKQGPADLTFKEEWVDFQGPVFFALFWIFVRFLALG